MAEASARKSSRRQTGKARGRIKPLFEGACQWGEADDPIAWGWLRSLAARNLSSATIRAYKQAIGELRNFVGDRFCGWHKWDPAEMKAFLTYMHREGRKRNHQALTVTALRGFFRSLEVDPGLALKEWRNRGKGKVPEVLTVGQMSDLLDAPMEIGRRAPKWVAQWVPLRDRAMLEVLYSTGARLEELRQMCCEDFDVTLSEVKVEGKGGKQRICYLHDGAREAVSIYMDAAEVYDRPPLVQRRGSQLRPVWLSSKGKQLSRRSVAKVITKAGLKSGVGGIHPHMFRHSMATHLLDAGADIRSIQEILGHRTMSSTQIYTKVAIGKAQEVHAEAHPRG